MGEIINTAIDGPSGAGKSTISREAALRLGFLYVDTGAMYRAVALYMHRNGISVKNISEVEANLDKIDIRLKYIENTQHIFLNGEDVSESIRENKISILASAVSAIPAVRAFLLDMQRDIAAKNCVIMDGRDIGTVVLPNADVKIFLTAREEVRAERRYKELLQRGQNISYENVLNDIKKRDFDDANRAAAPLRQADDAALLDTSDLSFEESVSAVIRIICAKSDKKTTGEVV